MKIADQIGEWLYAKHISDVFGIIGSGNIAIWEAITRLEKSKIHCFHHEQAAAQAAVFYHRVTGKHAAVLVTTGAGSSNVVTGILCAWMDSVPLLCIAGNEPTHFLESNARAKGAQGYDFIETLGPITKSAKRLLPSDNGIIGSILETSYDTMMDGRQGPVVVEVPINVQNLEVAQ